MLFLLACGCNEEGSVTTQCDDKGICDCKPGYLGDTCYSCDFDHYQSGNNCTGKTFV